MSLEARSGGADARSYTNSDLDALRATEPEHLATWQARESFLRDFRLLVNRLQDTEAECDRLELESFQTYDRPIVTYEPRTDTERELVRRLERLKRLECDRCAATAPNATPEPCYDCITGLLRGRIKDLEAEFHLDWPTNRWVGRCGHRWARLEAKKPERCPVCELTEKGRPKGLVKRIAELSFYG